MRWDDEGNIFRDISEITYIHTYKCKRWKKNYKWITFKKKRKIKNDEELVDRIDRIDRLYILRHYIYIHLQMMKRCEKFSPKKENDFQKRNNNERSFIFPIYI